MIEIDLAIVSIPLDEITKIVLGEETVSLDVVGIDLKAILYVVSTVVDRPGDVVVCSPEPGVVNDNILVVNLDHALSTDL